MKLSAVEIEAALKAARVMGLDVAGVDLVRSRRGPLVLEVNSSPGLEGIEGATGIDVAGEIIDFVAARASMTAGVRKRPARKGRARGQSLTTG